MTSDSVERARDNQLLAGVAIGENLMLRSASSLTRSIADSGSGARLISIAPQVLAVINTTLPFSQNYGALWAGRGLNLRTLTGFRLESARARLIFAPELIISGNADWGFDRRFYTPAPPAGYNEYSMPYYRGPLTIDVPVRYGNHVVRRLDPGETSALVNAGAFTLGFSNENEWWGPGIRNAIVMSNNAPGFPHLLVRTARPLNSRFGAWDLRWLVGGLTESAFFDTVSTNNTRSLAALTATLQTGWDPNLTVGFARSVYGTASGWSPVFLRWFDVFRRTHETVPDTTGVRRDQLFSLFARWVLPADGVEVYGEWGRTQLKPSLRDFITAPNHTQAYTLGTQWRGGEWRGGTFRTQLEITQLEQSATFREEPVGSWYTSQRVIQGYTNRGQVIGASIGPGSSSQWLAVDFLKPGWRFGGFLGRIRWNQDAHNHYPFPVYVGYCNQDVSIYPGLRAARIGGMGSISGEFSIQQRLTPFFQNGGGCPNNGTRLDLHNGTLSVSYSPLRW